MPYFPNGLGQALGDSLIVSPGGPIYCRGKVWYVDSSTGDNTYDGRSMKRPFASLAGAHADADVASGDTLVLMDGHAETFTSALTISKELIIVGGGQSSGKPTVKLTNNQANGNMLTITADNVQLRNIWFEEETQSNASATIVASGDGFRMVGCYLELDENSTIAALTLGQASNEVAFLHNTTFISTAAANTSVPNTALFGSNAGTIWCVGCTFDGGQYGFEEGFAYDEDQATAAPEVRVFDQVTLLRGADMRFIDSGTTVVQVSADSEEPRIDTDGAVAA